MLFSCVLYWIVLFLQRVEQVAVTASASRFASQCTVVLLQDVVMSRRLYHIAKQDLAPHLLNNPVSRLLPQSHCNFM